MTQIRFNKTSFEIVFGIIVWPSQSYSGKKEELIERSVLFCHCLKKECVHAYVDIGFSPADCGDDEDGSQAGTDDDHRVDCNEGEGKPLRDCQH